MSKPLAINKRALLTLEERLEQQRRQLATDLAGVMSTEGGRRVLWDIIHNISRAHAQSFNPHGSQAAFNEGQRSTGLRLEAACRATSRRLYLTMVDEALALEDEQQMQRAEIEALPDKDD